MSANVEATGSNPVEAPKNFFRAISELLKLRLSCDGHISFQLHFEILPFNDSSLRIMTAAGLAQSVERLTAEREVAGSIPGAGPILWVLK